MACGGIPIAKQEKSNNTELPPCRVCGDKASGFHYGVNTCEACKGFFRRSLKRDQQYKCRGNIKCNIKGGKLNAKCPKCRLEKCLEVGMSKENIQMGRYTLEKRSEYIVEIKKQEDKEQSADSAKYLDIDDLVVDQQSFVESYVTETSDDLLWGSNHCSSTKADIDEIESVIDKFMSIHSRVTYSTSEFLNSKSMKEQAFLEKCSLEEKLYGKMESLSMEEYTDIKNETGMDIDGREELIHKGNSYAEDYALKTAIFVKVIPEFSHLCPEDQLTLLKRGVKMGVPELLSPERFNTDRMLYHSPCGTIYTMDTFKKLTDDPDCLVDWFCCFKKLHALKLTKEELMLSVAVFTLLIDEFELKEAQKVESSLNTCLNCLLHLIAHNHSRDKFVFPKLVSFLVEYCTSTASVDHTFFNSLEESFKIKIHDIIHECYK